MQPASDSCLSLLKGPNCPLHLTSSDCHLTRFPRKIRHGNLPPFRNDLGINRSEVSTDAFLKSLPCRPPIPPSGACHLVQSACLTSLCWLDTRGPHAKASFEPQAFSILRSTHPWLLSWIGSCVFFRTFSSLPPSSYLPPPIQHCSRMPHSGLSLGSGFIPSTIQSHGPWGQAPHFSRPVPSAEHQKLDRWPSSSFILSQILEVYDSTVLKKNNKRSVITRDFQPTPKP